MRNEFLNMKDVIIKHLQNENELHTMFKMYYKDKVVLLESSVNHFDTMLQEIGA